MKKPEHGLVSSQNWANTNCMHGPDGHATHHGHQHGQTAAAIQLDADTKLPVIELWNLRSLPVCEFAPEYCCRRA